MQEFMFERLAANTVFFLATVVLVVKINSQVVVHELCLNQDHLACFAVHLLAE